MESSTNAGILRITEDTFYEKLNLRKNVKIKEISFNRDFNCFDFSVEGNGVPKGRFGVHNVLSLEQLEVFSMDHLELMSIDVDYNEAIAKLRKGYYIMRNNDSRLFFLSTDSSEPVVKCISTEIGSEVMPVFTGTDIINDDWCTFRVK